MQILITGAAGFIGFNISKFLLLNKKIKVYGIDNLNDYYSVSQIGRASCRERV